ncbi:MAG: hypothetical protein UT24_C0033G0003 [Candidatus Woesebacteria bacterium GW2011_GWB1_39_12]|uniref:Uncharacterized protein n=1 Tax=Candidatus Woesebacteria bacterium GW2011_GWB1_39_12 TaxID=1618574 RepID=A0A0G0M3V2_9BACT|nr:MAG: hypothetical protein UT24_C0033G0003 [Candidatus Woesebacteria bacterium GW2011_GWB1_39_12]
MCKEQEQQKIARFDSEVKQASSGAAGVHGGTAKEQRKRERQKWKQQVKQGATDDHMA